MSKNNSPGPVVKEAYRKFLVKSTATNVSLKTFVKNQIDTNTPLKDACEEWLLNKAS